MSFYDIIILVVLFGAMIFGYMKGLAWQIASVAAVVVSYIAAVQFRGQVAQYVQATPPFNDIAAMLIIFVASSLVIWLAYAYVNKSLEKAELDGFNRQIGALVGAVLGLLLVMVITLFSVSLLGKTAHDSIHNSKLGPYVVRGISMAQAFVPDQFQASLSPHFDTFYQQIGYDPSQATGGYPTFPGLPAGAVTGGSTYPTGATFNSSSQASYEGNWSPVDQQAQNNYYQGGNQDNGYPNNGYQPSQTQTNQGTVYSPQQQQPQSSGLPSINLKLDSETILKGGQWLQNNFSNSNGN